jgi:carotenoid cleavage dioxygenase-like enzyme
MLHLPIREGEVEYQSLAKEPLELPRIDYEHRNTRKYDFVYGISTYTPDEFASQLVKVDIGNGSKIWHEDNTYPGEPVFVPRPKSTEEDDGVVLSVLLDAKKGNSFLLILNARSFEELGRVEVPHHIPIGLHGQYFHDVT